MGLLLPLLEYPEQRAPHLEGYYYVYLQNFLAEHGCQLEFACVTRPEMEQENDFMIMDFTCDKPKYVLSDSDINKFTIAEVTYKYTNSRICATLMEAIFWI